MFAVGLWSAQARMTIGPNLAPENAVDWTRRVRHPLDERSILRNPRQSTKMRRRVKKNSQKRKYGGKRPDASSENVRKSLGHRRPAFRFHDDQLRRQSHRRFGWRANHDRLRTDAEAVRLNWL